MIKFIFVFLFTFAAQAEKPTHSLARPHVPGEVVVKYKNSASVFAQRNLRSSFGLQARERLKNVESFRIPARSNLAKTIEQIKKDPNVEWAQPNYIYRATALPDDTDIAKQWAITNTAQSITGGTYSDNNPGTAGKDLNVEAAWDYQTDCSAVTVAVIDTGIRHTHEDLAANMWDGGVSYPNHGYDFVDEDNDPTDENGHGTHVAGTVGAVGNNALGVAGVCWQVQLMAVRVLGADGSGSTIDIIEGIVFAVDEGAQIINLSLGGPGSDSAIDEALNYASDNGVFIAAAAGNEADNIEAVTTIPCNSSAVNMICVAALDQNLELASFSNYGSKQVDVGAPGTNIINTYAGVLTYVDDDLTSDWTFPAANPGWGYETINLSSGSSTIALDIIGAPDDYDGLTQLYANNLDARVYKNFDLTGADIVNAYFYVFVDMLAGDFFRIFYDNADVDPVDAGVELFECDDCTTDGGTTTLSYSLEDCANAADCNIGMQMTTNASGQFYGTALALFFIEKLSLNDVTYQLENGTSMATPHVAGVAALLKAFHPDYTAADIVAAIKESGETNADLTGKTSTGKSVDAGAAMIFVRTPQNLSVTGE